jgi:putative oxidoreductase
MYPSKQTAIAFVLGRLMVGGMYLYSGIANLIELDGKAGYAASKGLIEPTLGVTAASLLLIVAGLSLITGIRPRIGVWAVALFLIPVTVIMHNFWALEGMQRISEFHSFLGNFALLGSALMFLAVPRPWPLSLDTWVGTMGAAISRLREGHSVQRAEP